MELTIPHIWRVISLLQVTISTAVSQECIEGRIMVDGIQPHFAAGRVSLCYNGEWRAICHHKWDLQDARVACRQLGLPTEGAQFCRNSCFGNSDFRGVTDFSCFGNESSLLQCSFAEVTGYGNMRRCLNLETSGVVCPPHSPPTCQTCPTTPETPCSSTEARSTSADFETTPPFSEQTKGPPTTVQAPTTRVTDHAESAVRNCSAEDMLIMVVLGAVSAILLLSLVGVVTGWVWSSYRKGRTKKIREEPDTMDINPSYAQTVSTSVKKKVIRHKNKATPTIHTYLGDEDYMEVDKEESVQYDIPFMKLNIVS